MKLSKAIAEIQNEYGFTKEEEGDPRLAGIDRIAELDAQIRSRREELLAGVYHQVAVKFAELHDTPVRMKEKGSIKDIVPWKSARKFLYWRLRRKLLKTKLSKQITEASAPKIVGHQQIAAMIR